MAPVLATRSVPDAAPAPLIHGSPGAGLRAAPSFDSHGLSRKGRGRAANQDQFLVADLGNSLIVQQSSLSREAHSGILGRAHGRLLAVADGVSGRPGGAIASAVAVDTLARSVADVMPWFFRLDARGEDDVEEALRAAIGRCQARVQAAGRSDPGRSAMGTTLTLALVLWPRVYVVHVGDSRGYLRRGGKLVQVTRDHTVATQLVERGILTREQAGSSRWRHVLWNSLGADADGIAPEASRFSLEPGDVLLLCTDGLTGSVSDAGIAAALSPEVSAEETARGLLERAAAAGASDDVTVIVTRFP